MQARITLKNCGFHLQSCKVCSVVLRVESRTLCVPGQHSANWATAPGLWAAVCLCWGLVSKGLRMLRNLKENDPFDDAWQTLLSLREWLQHLGAGLLALPQSPLCCSVLLAPLTSGAPPSTQPCVLDYAKVAAECAQDLYSCCSSYTWELTKLVCTRGSE